MIAPDPALAGPRPAAAPRETAPKAGPQGRPGDDFDSVLKAKPAGEKREAATAKEPERAKPEAGNPEPAKSEPAAPDDTTDSAAALDLALPVPVAAPVAVVPAAPAASAVAPPVAAGDPVLAAPSTTSSPPVAAALPESREATPGAGETSREDPRAVAERPPSRGSTPLTKPAAAARVPEGSGPQAVPERDDELRPGVSRDAAAAESRSRAAAAAPRIAAAAGGDVGVRGLTYRDAAPPAWHLSADPGIAPVRSEAPPLPQTQPQTQPQPQLQAQAVQPQAVAGQVAVAIGRASDDRLEIRLDPPELGRVQIHLTRHDGAIQAVVLADRPETQDLLRRHAEVLTRELGQAGYDSVSLDFAGGQAWPGREDADMDWAQAAPEATAAPATGAPAVAPPRGGLAGSLDIRL